MKGIGTFLLLVLLFGCRHDQKFPVNAVDSDFTNPISPFAGKLTLQRKSEHTCVDGGLADAFAGLFRQETWLDAEFILVNQSRDTLYERIPSCLFTTSLLCQPAFVQVVSSGACPAGDSLELRIPPHGRIVFNCNLMVPAWYGQQSIRLGFSRQAGRRNYTKQVVWGPEANVANAPEISDSLFSAYHTGALLRVLDQNGNEVFRKP